MRSITKDEDTKMAFLIEGILDTLIEVGNGVTDEMLHESADDLFAIREILYGNTACSAETLQRVDDRYQRQLEVESARAENLDRLFDDLPDLGDGEFMCRCLPDVSDVPPMPKVKPAKEETGKDIVLNALKELWGITGEMPPNFRCPKRCSICKFFEIKGLIFRKGYCKKYSIEIGGIGCCDSYIYMTE